MENNASENLQKLAEKINNIKTAMLVTAEQDGTLRARPMQTLKIEGNYLWFLTAINSPKSHEIRNESHVNLSFADESNKLYVSVSGVATVSRDRQKIDELWSEPFKAWFPEGKEDPNIAAIRVEITQAEYWDTPTSPVVHLIGYAKAVVTGEPYHPGDNEKINVTK
ncbi:pyridoxamine 5'-phosphate oxidase family protein [Adhaeribacter rhizoryzae]|uniref:Pyridoxamine 5'-phosphate oxidase family protein n=1 Tax=Adhaeribacter rhizoryzae TaxID=2607907 RepID=A0A5M6DK80_9BACT|nr:pyridoxamine 5'-phosphate oxidase family protein [Adhaeribacter rhizoryzae]KAA5547911.1 pyridoxamine 5'-phosphate oxidase family protein [Adhaeribacter rhizoryzae]